VAISVEGVMIPHSKQWYALRMAKAGKSEAAIANATGLSLPEIDKLLREVGLK
jgi:hypothetical protein